LTPTGRDRDINSILERFDKASEVHESEIGVAHGHEAHKLIAFMIHSDIIKKYNPNVESYILGMFGSEVVRSGGWLKYLEDQKKPVSEIETGFLLQPLCGSIRGPATP